MTHDENNCYCNYVETSAYFMQHCWSTCLSMKVSLTGPRSIASGASSSGKIVKGVHTIYICGAPDTDSLGSSVPRDQVCQKSASGMICMSTVAEQGESSSWEIGVVTTAHFPNSLRRLSISNFGFKITPTDPFSLRNGAKHTIGTS